MKFSFNESNSIIVFSLRALGRPCPIPVHRAPRGVSAALGAWCSAAPQIMKIRVFLMLQNLAIFSVFHRNFWSKNFGS